MNKSTQRGVLSRRDFNQLVFVAEPAFSYELRSSIPGHKMAAAAARFSFVNNEISYDQNKTVIFELPNKL